MNTLAHRLSAIAIVLDAQAIQRKREDDFLVSSKDVAAMSNIPVADVERIGSMQCERIRVPDREVGYFQGQFRIVRANAGRS